MGDGKLVVISMTVSGINDRIRFYSELLADSRVEKEQATPLTFHCLTLSFI